MLNRCNARRRLWAVLPVFLLAASTPFASAQQVSQEGLDGLRELLEETKTRAALVMHDGEIVAEWYWLEGAADKPCEVWSVSKSFASTCIGLLIDEGKIDSLDDPVGKYVPSWNEGDKAKVTLAHLLDQTSGLQEAGNFIFSSDQLKAALDAPLITPPGEVGRYNNAGCNVLSAVISAAAGEDPESYMRRKVWEPIGMNHTSWRRDRAGNVITYAGIQTTARDLARFGQLFLQNGSWEGNTIVSSGWIELATRERTRLSTAGVEAIPYGLLWWVDFSAETVPHNYSALGLFGNNLTVIPDKRLIGVRLVGSRADGGGLMLRTPEWVERLSRVVPD